MSSGFDDFGKDINSIVKDAIRSGNYENLGASINNSFKNTVSSSKRDEMIPVNVLYKPTHFIKISLFIKAALFLVCTNLTLLLFAIFGWAVPSVILSLVSLMLIAKIRSEKHLLKIYTSFLSALKNRRNKTFIDIETLSVLTGKTEKETLKAVKKCIRRNWFKQGHLDRKNTTLITANSTYRLYLETEKERHARQQSKILQAKYAPTSPEVARDTTFKDVPPENDASSHLPKETLNLLRSGKDYITKLRTLNDSIEDKIVSEKITQMEATTQSIFSCVESCPRQAVNLRRFMNYYLPTAIKLLEVYDDLDDQQTETQNIQKTKTEIEDALDNLNIAFKKIFDDLFEDTSLDIASDISVLNNFLAKDGYTQNPFEETKDQ